MDMVVAEPAHSSLVKAVWSVAGPADEAVLPGVVVPDSHVEFVFHLGNPWRMRSEGQTIWKMQPSAFVCAQSHGALRFEGEGNTSLIAFRVSPVVACSILGRPPTDIWNEPVALADLIGSDADVLHDRLTREFEQQRFSLLEGWIRKRLSNWTSADWKSERMFGHLMWHAPERNLATLSKHLGWSARGLRRVLANAAALSPKDVQLAGRHLDACALLRDQPRLGVTEIAAHVGFFDHAAFTHSFRERMGMTPSQFRSESHAFFERRP